MFQPGQSGNPSGRPKNSPATDIFKELFNDPETREQIKENVRKTLTKPGMAGVLLFKEGTDRLEGRVIERVEVSDYRDLTDEELEAKLKALQDARTGT
jgi:hypothetical protein